MSESECLDHLPKYVAALCAAMTIAGSFTVDASRVHRASIEITDDERVALVITQFGVPSGSPDKELFRVVLTAESAKMLGWHLEKAGWWLDTDGVACACTMCQAVAANTYP